MIFTSKTPPRGVPRGKFFHVLMTKPLDTFFLCGDGAGVLRGFAGHAAKPKKGKRGGERGGQVFGLVKGAFGGGGGACGPRGGGGGGAGAGGPLSRLLFSFDFQRGGGAKTFFGQRTKQKLGFGNRGGGVVRFILGVGGRGGGM